MMSRTHLLTLTTVLALGIASVVRAEESRARVAKAAYDKAVKAAREAYIEQLELAIKEEGGAGNLEEANRLAEEKKSLELEGQLGSSDPADLAAKKLQNTTWKTRRNPKGFLRFLKDNKTQNHLKTGGVWIATDKDTVITQSRNSGAIYMFQFSKDLRSARVHRFESKGKPETYFKR